jgi:hypothetical protein
MPGMADMPTGDGLTAEASGFRFAPVESSLPTGQPAGAVALRRRASSPPTKTGSRPLDTWENHDKPGI